MKAFFQKKGRRFYFVIFSLVAGVCAAPCYLFTTIIYSNSLGAFSMAVTEWIGLITTIIGVLLLLTALLWKDVFGIFTVFVPALYMFSLTVLFGSQVQNIAYALAGIADIGIGILPSFVAGGILYIIAIPTGIAGAVFRYDFIPRTNKLQKVKEDKNEKEQI